jgi:hypothetical protein
VSLIASGFAFWVALYGAADSKFLQLRPSAEPLGSLGAFLEKYIGECPQTAPQCRNHATAFRSQANGRRFYMLVTEESAKMLSTDSRELARGGQYTLQVTPFFSAGPYALTHGAPSQTDANGNPVMPLLLIHRKAPDDWTTDQLQRIVNRRELRVEVIFTPQGVWTLPRRSGGRIHGVRAKIEGLQVTNARTGEVVGVWP